jgi:two-component system response regulator LytT
MDTYTYNSIMEAVHELLPQGASLAITDEKQYICYKPSSQIDLKIQPGDVIKEGTASHKALSVQHRIEGYFDKRILGVPYFGMSFPLLEATGPKGCVTVILRQKPKQLQPSILTVKMVDRWIPVPLNQIMFLEALNRKTIIHAERVTGNHKYNLTELEWQLPENVFIRCHRSYIVNICFISEIHPDSHSTFLLIMKDGTRIPVSQSYSSYFRRMLCF